MGIWNLEARFRENDFESKALIEENCNQFSIVNVDFASMSKPEDFDTAGRMLIQLSDMLIKLNGE